MCRFSNLRNIKYIRNTRDRTHDEITKHLVLRRNLFTSHNTIMSTDVVDFTANTGEEDTSLVSERVSALAQAIYEEFQKIVGQFGADSISNLAPLIVNVLESWDSALNDNRDHLAALDELSEENVQLTTQYEREKHLRRETEEVRK